MNRPSLEMADIVHSAGDDFIKRSRRWISWQHQKVLLAITRCRTAALGGHRDRCSACGHTTAIPGLWSRGTRQTKQHRNVHALSSPTYCTVTVTVPVFVMAPEVAVTVMMYVPAVVPGVTTLGQATPPPFPLHATTPPTNAMNNSPKLNIDRQVRLRFGMTKRNKLARAAPLPAYHGIPLGI